MRAVIVAAVCVLVGCSGMLYAADEQSRDSRFAEYIAAAKKLKAKVVRDLQNELTAVKRGSSPPAEKAGDRKRLEARIKEANKPDALFWPPLPELPKVGQIGTIPDERPTVAEVIDADEMVVVLTRYELTMSYIGTQIQQGQRKATTRVIVKGVPTEDRADGQRVEIGGVFEVTGTQRSFGETLLVLTAVDHDFLVALYDGKEPNKAEPGSPAPENEKPQPTPLAELDGGFSLDSVLDCSKQTHPVAVSGIDFAKSWTLALDANIATLAPQWQMLLFWGDSRGGKDPFWFRIESGKMTVGLVDARIEKGIDLKASLDEKCVGRWTAIQADYDAPEKTLRLFIDGEFQAETKIQHIPTADKPMPWTAGGLNAGDHRFNGQIRNIRFGNRK